MDRRQFFKSSALWLAGLLVAPHLKFAPVGRRSVWLWMTDTLTPPKFPLVHPGLTFSLTEAYEMLAEAISKSVDEFDQQKKCQAVMNYVLERNYGH